MRVLKRSIVPVGRRWNPLRRNRFSVSTRRCPGPDTFLKPDQEFVGIGQRVNQARAPRVLFIEPNRSSYEFVFKHRAIG